MSVPSVADLPSAPSPLTRPKFFGAFGEKNGTGHLSGMGCVGKAAGEGCKGGSNAWLWT